MTARLARLPYFHIDDMVFHMKTTLNIDDTVMTRLKQEAARRGVTMSWLVESALRALLDARPAAKDLPPLPTFNGGQFLVDVSDRRALYDVMNEDDDARLYGARKRD
jgi:hypothetical protein